MRRGGLGRVFGKVEQRPPQHRGDFGEHRVGRNPIFLIKHFISREADLDREPQAEPQGFAVDAGKMRAAGIRQPVGDMPV